MSVEIWTDDFDTVYYHETRARVGLHSITPSISVHQNYGTIYLSHSVLLCLLAYSVEKKSRKKERKTENKNKGNLISFIEYCLFVCLFQPTPSKFSKSHF